MCRREAPTVVEASKIPGVSVVGVGGRGQSDALERGVAQFRFTRTLRRPRDTRTVTRSYVATVGYDFQPETRQRLQDVWANPLGFVVTSYRVDAETLEN